MWQDGWREAEDEVGGKGVQSLKVLLILYYGA